MQALIRLAILQNKIISQGKAKAKKKVVSCQFVVCFYCLSEAGFQPDIQYH